MPNIVKSIRHHAPIRMSLFVVSLDKLFCEISLPEKTAIDADCR